MKQVQTQAFSKSYKQTLSQKVGWPALIGVGLATLLTVSLIWLSVLVFSDQTQAFDGSVEEAISSWNVKGLHTFFDFVTDPLTLQLIGVATVLFYLWRRVYWAAGFLFLASAGGTVISEKLKDLFQRVRPGVEIEDKLFSYPSDHATLATCLFGALIYIGWLRITDLRWRLTWSAFLTFIILSVGLSRIFFNLHYPTDVLAGFLTGSIYLFLLISGRNLLLHRKLRRKTANLQ